MNIEYIMNFLFKLFEVYIFFEFIDVDYFEY